MAQPKVKEHNEYLRIREEYLLPDGKPDFPELARYFKETEGFSDITFTTMYRWESKLNRDALRTPENKADSEIKAFLKKIKPHAEGGKNANYARLYAQIKGYLDNNKEDTQERGFTPAALIGIAQQVREALINEYRRGGGCCPICHRCEALSSETRLCADKGEATEDGEMATLGLPTRPS